MAITPTQRSLQKLRDEGYLATVAERWNPHARVRQDLFGFVDILALRKGETLAIQTTTASNFAARRKKVLAHENFDAVICAGWQVVVHGWRKNKAGKWELKEAFMKPQENVLRCENTTAINE